MSNVAVLMCGVKVCGGDPLKLLRPEELEMAVCGSSNLDFKAYAAVMMMMMLMLMTVVVVVVS